jgi:hypothetical protein
MYGWKIPFSSLDCDDIVGLGFLLYDGKAGDFNMQVESIVL